MPATRKRFYRCQHLGFGIDCARCALADKLEKMAAEGKEYITNKKSEKPHTWTKKEMNDEVKRLRGPQEHKKGKSGYTKSAANISLADSMAENDKTE